MQVHKIFEIFPFPVSHPLAIGFDLLSQRRRERRRLWRQPFREVCELSWGGGKGFITLGQSIENVGFPYRKRRTS